MYLKNELNYTKANRDIGIVLPKINVKIAGIVPIFNTFSTVFGESAILPTKVLKLL